MMSAARHEHPDDLLSWLVNDTLEGKERRRVEEHLRSCLRCRREVEELRALRRDVARAAPRPSAGGLERFLAAVEAERGGRRPWFRRAWAGAAAAAAAVAVAVGMASWPPAGPRPPAEERSAARPQAARPLVGPEEALPRDDFRLRWEAAPGWRQARFAVTVTTEDLTPVAQVEGLETGEYRVPAEALAVVPTGARLFWRLEAERPDGERWTQVFQARLE